MHTKTEILAETEPPKILPRILSSLDLVAIYFAVIFGSYGASQMASSGWAGIPMMLLATITFLIPCILASYELGTLFPNEGGIYVWVYKTLGAKHAFIAGWLSWLPIFLLLPLDANVIATFMQYILNTTFSKLELILTQVLIIWILFAICISKLEFSQRFVRITFFLSFLTAVFVFIFGVIHIKPVNPITSDIFSLNLNKWGFLYSAAVLWLLGVEVPFNLGAEYKNHKQTGKTMLLYGTILLLFGYFIGIVGILFSVPVSEIDPTLGVAQAVAKTSPLFSKIFSIIICLSVFSQAISTMNTYSRLLFVGSIQKEIPKIYSKLSTKNKVPYFAILTQSIGSTVVILIFSLLSTSKILYNLYLASLVAVWCLSLFYIYFALISARKNFPELYINKKDLIWKIPGGWFGYWTVFVFGVFFNWLSVYFVFAEPWSKDIDKVNWLMYLTLITICLIMFGIFTKVFRQSKNPTY